jgi:hypothetical protein
VNLITLRDGHGAGFVTVIGQIQMAASPSSASAAQSATALASE